MGNIFSQDPFRKVRTWGDLLRVNISFLKGEVLWTPYHFGPLEPDSVPLTGKLIALHKQGFLSVNGQAALIFDTPTHRFYQRSYLIGFLPGYHAISLANYFQKHRKSFVGRIWYLKKHIHGNHWELLLAYGDARMNQSKRFNLTKMKNDDGSWEYPTNFPLTSDLDYINYGGETHSFRNYPAIMALFRGMILVEIGGLTYGRDSTEDFLLDYFFQDPLGEAR